MTSMKSVNQFLAGCSRGAVVKQTDCLLLVKSPDLSAMFSSPLPHAFCSIAIIAALSSACWFYWCVSEGHSEQKTRLTLFLLSYRSTGDEPPVDQCCFCNQQ